MKIDTRFDTWLLTAPGNSNNDAQTGFQATLDAALRGLSSGGTGTAPATDGTASVSKPAKPATDYETAVKDLHEYLSKTPEQRMRDAILKEMGLTEDDIKKMSPSEQSAVEAAIKEKVKEKLLEQAQSNVDMAVGAP
ncbi:MAG: hypothetical protein JWL63_3032 [Rhodocyclales bacterium]|nr:hypothetical protein [Rhodocyclales bacterium]